MHEPCKQVEDEGYLKGLNKNKFEIIETPNLTFESNDIGYWS